mgnify:CR=1 FL=1
MNGHWFGRCGMSLGGGVLLTLAAVTGCGSGAQKDVAVAPPERDGRVAPDLSESWPPKGTGMPLRFPASDTIRPDDFSDVTPSSLQIERGMQADAWQRQNRFGIPQGIYVESPSTGWSGFGSADRTK